MFGFQALVYNVVQSQTHRGGFPNVGFLCCNYNFDMDDGPAHTWCLTSVLRDPITSGRCRVRVFTPGINMHPEYLSCDHLGSDLTSPLYMQISKLVIRVSEDQTLLFWPSLSYRCVRCHRVSVCARVCVVCVCAGMSEWKRATAFSSDFWLLRLKRSLLIFMSPTDSFCPKHMSKNNKCPDDIR